MKIIDLDGDAYERGLAQGAAMRKLWPEMERDFFKSELLATAKPRIVPNFVVGIAIRAWGYERTRPSVGKYLPSMNRRVLGLARGLGITRRYAWGIQYAEILFCLAGDSLAIPKNTGCTQVHAMPGATADGRPLTGRNYDFPHMLKPYQLVRRETPSEKDRMATMTATQIATCGSHQGINEAGLVIGANNNRAWMERDFNKKGIPSLMLLQEALETCRTTGEAADFITKFPARGAAGFFGMMDESGDCLVVEYTASRTAVRRPDKSGVMAQSNHFIIMKEANIPDGTRWKIKGMEDVEYNESSRARFAAADRRLRENAGKITRQTLMEILSDHGGNPAGKGDDLTVCSHGSAGSTLSSFVVDIRDRSMWAAEGNPCENKYEKIEFRYKS
jgi:hypothetical protein